MVSENSLRNAAAELITDCCSEAELTENIEKLRTALYSGCETQKHISLLKSQIRRAATSFSSGRMGTSEFDSKINKLQTALLELIYLMTSNEVAIPFEYTPRDGLIYHFYNTQGELIYKFYGKLLDNLPHGEGISKYPNGNYFKGVFFKGKRHGKGELLDKNGRVIKEGNWKNDVFIEKNAIEYFPNLKVAASLLQNGNSISDSVS